MESMARIAYFENIPLLQNTLLPYFCEPEPLKSVNKVFFKLNYEKYNTHIQPHGIKITYYPDTKILDIRTTYKNGKIDGLCESWHLSGELFNRCNHKNGKKNGLYEKYYKNGKLAKRFNFKNGELDGLYEEWYHDGRLRDKANYKNGKLDGVREKYYDYNKLVILNYKNGNKID